MISFSWSVLDARRFSIQIRSSVTRAGTLHRFIAAMYALGLDIDSGDVDTILEDGEAIASDSFEIHVSEEIRNPDPMEFLNRLGALMESLIHADLSPEMLLSEKGLRAPGRTWFFESPPVLVFQEHPEEGLTEFYLESINRRGLLFHLTKILAHENVEILRGSIRSSEYGMAQDTLYLHMNGNSLGTDLSEKLEKLILQGD